MNELVSRSLSVKSSVYKSFMSQGAVAPREGENEVVATILCDTGALKICSKIPQAAQLLSSMM